MRKFRKVASLALAFIMGLSISACDGKKEVNNTSQDITTEKVEQTTSNENTTEQDIEDVNTTEAVVDAANVITIPMPKDDGDNIVVYVQDEAIAAKLDYFATAYPQYKDKIQVEVIEVEDSEYARTVIDMLKNQEKAPSVVVCQDVQLPDMFASYVFKDLSEIGITEEMYENAYSYTLDMATFEGEKKALAWESYPNVFIYRSDIAEEVLKTSEPEEVMDYVKDWDSFVATAEMMKENDYKMLSGSEDIIRPFIEQNEGSLVEGNVVNIDENMIGMFELSKYLYQQDYTNNTSMYDNQWIQDIDGDVFGYFGGMEFINEYLNNSDSEFYGMRRMCIGPCDYYSGGLYIGATNKCKNDELAALLIYTLCCDEDVMYRMCEEKNIFVNNRIVIDKVIGEGKGACEALGGQSPYSVWNIASDNISASHITKYDSILYEVIPDVLRGYNEDGYGSAEEAVADLEEIILNRFDELKVE